MVGGCRESVLRSIRSVALGDQRRSFDPTVPLQPGAGALTTALKLTALVVDPECVGTDADLPVKAGPGSRSNRDLAG
jgi:hypothetical protein